MTASKAEGLYKRVRLQKPKHLFKVMLKVIILRDLRDICYSATTVKYLWSKVILYRLKYTWSTIKYLY